MSEDPFRRIVPTEPEITVDIPDGLDRAPYAPPPGQPVPNITYIRQSNGGCKYIGFGMMGCLFLVGVSVAVLLVTGSVSLNGLINSFQLGNILGSLANASVPAQASVQNSQTILVGIQPLGQLVSVSAQLAQAELRVGVTGGALNACGFSTNHVAQGTISAGVDLSRVTADDITFDAASNTYTIRLPYPELTSCSLDYIRQYERSFTSCNVDWDEARQIASVTALNNFRQQSLEGGILERAAGDAQLVLGNFVQMVSNANVVIAFDDPPAEPAIPPSCNPQAPPGWIQDAATGQWTKIG